MTFSHPDTRREAIESAVSCLPRAVGGSDKSTESLPFSGALISSEGAQVLSEKPLTTDVAKCKAILAAVEETDGSVRGESSLLSRSYLACCIRSTDNLSSRTVLFNYRYNPVYEKVFDVVRTSLPFPPLLSTCLIPLIHSSADQRRIDRRGHVSPL